MFDGQPNSTTRNCRCAPSLAASEANVLQDYCTWHHEDKMSSYMRTAASRTHIANSNSIPTWSSTVTHTRESSTPTEEPVRPKTLENEWLRLAKQRSPLRRIVGQSAR